MESQNSSLKRSVAYKLKVEDIYKAEKSIEDGKLLFIKLGDKKISRVNIIATAIDSPYIQDGEKKFGSAIIDDGSGQIKLKLFGDEIEDLRDLSMGDSLRIIGLIREWNNELYISPEIIKKVDPKWLLVRKLELKKMNKKADGSPISLRELIIDIVKNANQELGISKNELIMNMDASKETVEAEIVKLIGDATFYEPRPGILKIMNG